MNTMPWDEPSRLAYYGADPYKHTRMRTLELDVPAQSIRAQANAMSAGEESVRAIATPVVIAELRRLATHWDNLRCTSMDVIEALHQRADELEAGQ